MALLALASITSLSLTAPTAPWITWTRTSSLVSFSKDWRTASTEPCTSALTMIFSSFISPCCIWSKRLSRVTLVWARKASSFRSVSRCCTSSLARRSSDTALKISPPTGTSFKPVISTGTLGPASVTRRPLSSIMERTRPTVVPATITSPSRRVPFCTSTVAMGPMPLSSLASTTVPLPARSGLALSSAMSAVSKIISSRSSMPSLVWAETGTQGVSPPQSSGTRPYSVSCSLTRSGLAPTLSILLMATMMDTSAALAWLMASTVWGMMPSSAATTSTAISVTMAPLARMVVKAAWPGVSRKVMSRPPTRTRYAPMCWVMPPASPSVTLVWRITSKIEVLPWSTWPITTTTGARGVKAASSSALSSMIRSSMVTTTSFSTLAWNSSATSTAVSKSMVSLTVANTPKPISFLMTSGAVAFSRRANSPTVISSGTSMVMRFSRRCFSMRARRSRSVSRLPRRWGPPRRCWLRLVNFCLFTRLSVRTFWSARLSYRSLYRSIFTWLVRVSTTRRTGGLRSATGAAGACPAGLAPLAGWAAGF